MRMSKLKIAVCITVGGITINKGKNMKKLVACLAIVPSLVFASNEAFQGLRIVKSKTFKTNILFHETNEEDNYINYFLKLKSVAPAEIKHNKNANELDTHLKAEFKDIKLSVPFKYPSIISKKELIGFAAIGSYNNGWSGIRIFFSKPELGECSLSLKRAVGVQLPENMLSYSVNKKPTTKSIIGNNNAGYLYDVSWEKDNKTSVDESQLECVNKKYDESILTNMIKFGSQLDSFNSIG